MLCEVVLCRCEGRRLRKSEWPEPVFGRLVVREMRPEHTSFRRYVRSAELKASKDAYGATQIDVVPPLFEPELLPSPDGTLLLRGIGLHVDGDDVIEVEQVWLCTPK